MTLQRQLTFGSLFVLLALLYQWNTRALHNYSLLLTDHVDKEYDYIIVGAGSAGSVLASRLTEDKDKKVLLLEAGGHFDESPLFHIPLGWVESTEHDWGYYTEKQTDIFKGLIDNRGYWPRGKVVGGSSISNGMQYTRGSRFDYDGWAAEGCEGWSYKDVLPYFLKSEDIQIDTLKDSPYHSTGGPLAVSYSPPTGLTNEFLKAGKQLGYDATDYNGEHQEGFSIVQSNVRGGVRSSAGLEFLGRPGKRDNLHIVVRSMVIKIHVENDKAVGVYYIRNNRKYYVKSRKEVILSAGSINSPQLLLLSGIGPKDHLHELGIEVVKDLPVGQYLKDHQLVLLPSTINKPLSLLLSKDNLDSWWTRFQYDWLKQGPLSLTGLDGSAFLHLDKSKRHAAYPDIQISFFSSVLSKNVFNFQDKIAKDLIVESEHTHGFTSDVCLTHPYSTGSLKLRSTDPFDYPVIEPGYYTDQRDVKQMIGGIRNWEKLTETEAFKNLGVEINQLKVSFCSQFPFRSDEYWECYIRHVSMTEYHPACTCRMGPDSDPLAVVDPQLRVKGIFGLRVVDASVFHNITSGNTNAPTIMIAEKAADMIRGIDTVGKYRNRI